MTRGQEILPPIYDPSVLAEVQKLARQYQAAGGLGMEILATIGDQAEHLLARLPEFVRKRMDRIVMHALERSFDAAAMSRRVLRDRGDWFNRLTSTASGAIGGVGGLPGAMVELPVTVTLLLRGMLDIAVEHGFDPASDEVRIECLRVFADAGPAAHDDGTDLGLLAAKLSITGQTLHGLIAKIAPRVSAVLGQKLAAQATPVLGAVAGATINYNFARYYQQLARVHFGLMRLAKESEIPKEALIDALQKELAHYPPSRRAGSARV